MTTLPNAEAPARPRFRGWIHGAATPAAVAVAVLLWRRADMGTPRLSVLVFGVALVALYAVSATYHVPPWPPRVREILGRADVATIQLFIAASFTPVAVHTLDGELLRWSMTIAWTVAIAGAVVAASPLTGPRWLGVLGYVAFGGALLVPLVAAVDVLPVTGSTLIVGSALLYALGGVVYARRSPNPWPRFFAFHEVFHSIVVLASSTFVLAVWKYVLPLA